MRRRLRQLASLVAIAALASAGCAVQPQGGSTQTSASGASGGPFRPDSIRIHPLTRVVAAGQSGDLVIDAHVELFDQWGHPTKGLGLLRFELFRAGPGGIGAGPEGGIVRAEVDMADPEINSTRYYDSATRTYRMYLEAPPDANSATMTLVATFLPDEGGRLRDEYMLNARVQPRDESVADENAPPAEGRQGGS